MRYVSRLSIFRSPTDICRRPSAAVANAQCSFAEKPAANEAQGDLNKVMEACTMLCNAAHPMSHAIMEAKDHVKKNSKRSAHHH